MTAYALQNQNNSSESDNEPLDYKMFCQYLEEACGITLGENKNYLINSRLKSIKEQYGFSTLTQIVEQIKNNNDSSLKVQIIDAMTTNETSWFRDNHPFEVLKTKIFPELKSINHVPKVWSAACSYGQEPYSISIAFEEYLEKNPGQFTKGLEIVGTDISRRALSHARAAEYDELGLARGLSPERKSKYFKQTEHGMQVVNKVKQRVRLQEFNLLNSYATLGKFDVIFCRNVLIYFSNDNKKAILKKITECLQPKGYLFLGASEPVVNHIDSFEMDTSAGVVLYRRK